MKRSSAALVLALVTAGVLAPATRAVAAPAFDPHLSLVSVGHPEDTTADSSGAGGISDDGRYVVFTSRQPNLVPGQTADAGEYAYLRDTVAGTTTRLTFGTLGQVMGNVAISGDGRYVAVPYIHSGIYFNETRLRLYKVSTGTWRTIAEFPPSQPRADDTYTVAISDDGSEVAYTHTAVVPVGVTDTTQAYTFNTVTGVTSPLLTDPVDALRYDSQVGTVPAVSGDGRYVALLRSTDLEADQPAYQLVRVDTQTGAVRAIATSAPAVSAAITLGDPSISDNGRLIGYRAPAADGTNQAYVYDARTRVSTLISHAPTGGPGADDATPAVVSGDGRYTAYAATSDRIVPGTPAGYTIYLHDNTADTTRVLVRTGRPSHPGGPAAASGFPSIDEHGDAVAFLSSVPGLSPGTSTAFNRVYLWRR